MGKKYNSESGRCNHLRHAYRFTGKVYYELLMIGHRSMRVASNDLVNLIIGHRRMEAASNDLAKKSHKNLNADNQLAMDTTKKCQFHTLCTKNVMLELACLPSIIEIGCIHLTPHSCPEVSFGLKKSSRHLTITQLLYHILVT